nr:hypothetical protein [uncultured Allomuricauda sp.]
MDYCDFCKTKKGSEEKSCQNCGLPFDGSEAEKSNHITNIFRTNEKLQEALNALQRAKWILFAIGISTLVFQFYSFYLSAIETSGFLFLAGLSLMITICGFATNDYPIPSVIMGTIFVIAMYGFSAYLEPSNMFKGVIWKIMILAALTYAIKTAIEYDKMPKSI